MLNTGVKGSGYIVVSLIYFLERRRIPLKRNVMQKSGRKCSNSLLIICLTSSFQIKFLFRCPLSSIIDIVILK